MALDMKHPASTGGVQRGTARSPHPEVGEIAQAGLAFDFSDIAARIQCHRLVMGEETMELRGDLGFRVERITALVDAGAEGVDPARPPAAAGVPKPQWELK